jgi:hypothetical protein
VRAHPTGDADRVREHLRLNGDRATVVQKALADRPGTLRITCTRSSRSRPVL